MNIKEIERLVTDLHFDYERLSLGGKETLTKLSYLLDVKGSHIKTAFIPKHLLDKE